jgi:hypothetical protein
MKALFLFFGVLSASHIDEAWAELHWALFAMYVLGTWMVFAIAISKDEGSK